MPDKLFRQWYIPEHDRGRRRVLLRRRLELMRSAYWVQ